jgi:hypothetical protein
MLSGLLGMSSGKPSSAEPGMSSGGLCMVGLQ